MRQGPPKQGPHPRNQFFPLFSHLEFYLQNGEARVPPQHSVGTRDGWMGPTDLTGFLFSLLAPMGATTVPSDMITATSLFPFFQGVDSNLLPPPSANWQQVTHY